MPTLHQHGGTLRSPFVGELIRLRNRRSPKRRHYQIFFGNHFSKHQTTHAHTTDNLHQERSGTRQARQGICRGFFFGKTVIFLTNNLHGRTRRRRGKHQGRGEGAESAAARRARPTRAGVSRDVGLRSRRCQAPLRARAREGWVLVDGYPGGPHSPQGCMWTRLGARHRGHLLFAACCM